MSLLLLLLLQPITAGGRDGWYTWFVVHARGGSATRLHYATGAPKRRSTIRIGGTVIQDVIVVSAGGGVVAIGNARQCSGGGGGAGAHPRPTLRLNRLQWVALVDAGHPVVPAFFEHLAYLAGAQAGREAGRIEALGQLTDGATNAGRTAATGGRCRRRGRRRCRGRGTPIARGDHRRR
uniref:Putative secreted protein n=1 Tax=Anopheles triannulatus TaxID=58253 RepID=A0A2M4B598_9DIPT